MYIYVYTFKLVLDSKQKSFGHDLHKSDQWSQNWHLHLVVGWEVKSGENYI